MNENVNRLRTLLGVEPTRAMVSHVSSLPKDVRAALPAGTRARRAVVVNDAVVSDLFSTAADVSAWFLNRVCNDEPLPAVSSLPGDVVAAIEQITERTYSELVDHYVELWGARAPGRSRNELALEEAIVNGFGSRLAAIRSEELVCDDRRYRWDFSTVISDGVHDRVVVFEADGQGHFQEVRNWNLARQRANDVAKAARLGPDDQLVAVHHGLLSGSTAGRLDGDTLVRIVDAARAVGAWWVFIRPSGSQDLRAVEGPVSRLVIEVDGVDVFVVATSKLANAATLGPVYDVAV